MTPADIAALPVDAVFATFGVAASYTAPGIGAVAVPCTVLLDAADRVFDTGQGRGVVKGRVVEVRISEIAAPARAGTFTITATSEVLKVTEDPRIAEDDPERLVWIMRVS